MSIAPSFELTLQFLGLDLDFLLSWKTTKKFSLNFDKLMRFYNSGIFDFLTDSEAQEEHNKDN